MENDALFSMRDIQQIKTGAADSIRQPRCISPPFRLFDEASAEHEVAVVEDDGLPLGNGPLRLVE